MTHLIEKPETAPPIETGTPEWRAARQRSVGGSEVAALFGLDPRLSRWQLWQRKAGHLPEADLSDNERVEAGNMLEPAVAAWVAKRTGWDVVKWPKHEAHPSVEGMAASLDYAINDRPDAQRLAGYVARMGALEIKCVDFLVYRGWEDDQDEKRKAPPLRFLLQLQHQLACTGWAWGALGVLVGGNQLEIYEYERHPATIAKIEAEVAAFWESVREGREPTADFMADADAIKTLHRDVSGEAIDLTASNRLPILCDLYKAAGADEAAAKARKDAAYAEILTLIGGAGLALTKGYRIRSTIVAGGPVAFERKPYRRVTITATKED